MRLPVIVLISLLIVSNTCAGWLTFGGKIHSDTTDTVTGVQSQQLVNVESGLTVVSPYTNGAALGETALQPADLSAFAATGTVWAAQRLGGTGSWTTVENGTNWLYTVTRSSNVVVTVVSGDGYNGPPVGTVFGNYFYEVGIAWYWSDGMGNTLKLSAQTLYGSGTWAGMWEGSIFNSVAATNLPAPMSYLGGQFVLDWTRVTNRVQVVTEPMVSEAIDEHNTNLASHADIRAAIAASLATGTVYTAINQISPVASNITVAVLGGRRIYNIETDVPISLFDCDLSGLDLDGTKEARWEVWINYTHSNALETTWADTIEWKRWEPELTVTGRYKFAFSAVGNEIEAEQLYPTQTIWSTLEREEAQGGGYDAYTSRFVCGAGTTNFMFSNLSAFRGVFAIDPDATELILIKPQFRGYSGPNTFVYGVAGEGTSYYTGTPEAKGVIWRAGGSIGHNQVIQYPIMGFELENIPDKYLQVWIGHISGTGQIFLQPGSFWIRKANELEKKAWFNDGWRP